MKRSVVLTVMLILAVSVTSCNFPVIGGAAPTATFAFAGGPRGGGQTALGTPTLVRATTAAGTPSAPAKTAIPAGAATKFVPTVDVDPKNLTETVTPKAGEVLKAGVRYALVYPGIDKAGIGVWFWIAKQYGNAIPSKDLLDNMSKYSQAYKYWVKEGGPKSKFGWDLYHSDHSKPIPFTFYLPK